MDIIQKPITLAAKVAKTLGTSKMSDGALCTHLSINKWAKCKPFNNSKETFSTENERDQARENANYGLLLPTLVRSGIYTGFAENSWSYVARTAPYRIGDFTGYYHEAKMPFVYAKDITASRLFDETVAFVKPNLGYNADRCVPVMDMLKKILNGGQQGDVYIGVYLYRKGGYLTFREDATGCKLSDLQAYAIDNVIVYNLFATNIAKEKVTDAANSESVCLPMPWTASIEEIKGKITIVDGDLFSLNLAKNFTGIRRSGGSYADPTLYIDQVQDANIPVSKYFPIGNGNWMLQLKFSVANTTNTAKYISAAKITVYTESNFYNQSSNGGVKMYNGGAYVDDHTLSVPAGETVNLEIQLNSTVLFGNNRPPASGVMKDFNFQFRYNGMEWFSRRVRLSSN